MSGEGESDGLTTIVETFQRGFSPQDVDRFRRETSAGLQEAVARLQKEQAKENHTRNLNRIRPFVHGLSLLASAMTELFNAKADVLAVLWGPMSLCLQISSKLDEALDALLDAYETLGQKLPNFPLPSYILYPRPHVKQILTNVLEDILTFHKRAVLFFKQKTWKLAFKSTIQTFSDMYGDVSKNLARSKDLLLQSANLTYFQEIQEARILFAREFQAQADRDKSQRVLAVMNWLSPETCELQHEELRQKRLQVPDTTKWMFTTSAMHNWLGDAKSAPPRFWLSGVPGAGKTVLFSSVVDELLKYTSEAHVAFFYCKRSDPCRKTFGAVARSLIAQIFQSSDTCLDYLFENAVSKRMRQATPTETFKEVLEMLATHHDQLIIAIDGLDELEAFERQTVLSMIANISTSTGADRRVKFFLTSREERDISVSLHQSVRLDIQPEHLERDIDAYVAMQLSEVVRKFAPSKELTQLVKREVPKRSKGVFLLARLIMENLLQQEKVEDLERELDSRVLPKDIDEAYGRLLERVERQDRSEKSRKQALLVLELITMAVRPLKTNEIQGALSIDLDRGNIYFDKGRLRVPLDELCGPIVEVHADGTVDWIHSSARDYLTQDHSGPYIELAHAQVKLASLCASYLTFSCFQPIMSKEEIFDLMISGAYSFQEYATSNWIYHLETPSTIDGGNQGVRNGLKRSLSTLKSRHEYDATSGNRMVKSGQSDFETLRTIYKALHTLQDDEFPSELPYLLRHLSTVRSILEEEMLWRTEHVNLLTEAYGGRTFRCPSILCPKSYQGFNLRSLRRDHLKQHSRGENCPYDSCDFSFLGFRTQLELDRHLQTSHELDDDDPFSPTDKHVPTRSAILSALDRNDAQAVRILAAEMIAGGIKMRGLLVRSLEKRCWEAATATAEVLGSTSDLQYQNPTTGTALHTAIEQYGKMTLEESMNSNTVESLVGNISLEDSSTSSSQGGREKCLAIIRLLVQRIDVDINAPDLRGRVPISMALTNKSDPVIEILLTRADLNLETLSYARQSLLFWAATTGSLNVLKRFLTQHDIDSSITRKNGRTLLSWAVGCGSASVVSFLLAQSDIELNIMDMAGRTPISWAAGNGKVDVARLLLTQSNLDLNMQDRDARTPLSWAVGSGKLGMVQLLLKRDDVDVNMKDKAQRTPLSWAAGGKSERVVKTLLAHGDVDINAADKDERTPLSWAVEGAHLRIVKAILAHGNSDVNARDKMGQTALSYAARGSSKEVVQLLLKQEGIDDQLADFCGRSPLSWAASNRSPDIAEALLSHNIAGLNIADNTGRTPLSWSATNDSKFVLQLLLRQDNIDFQTPDASGRTPLSWAAGEGFSEIMHLLLARKVDIHSPDTQGRTPLSWAASRNDADVMELLLSQNDINVNSMDKRGRTPLMRAAIIPSGNAVKILASQESVDVDRQDSNGSTALYYAVAGRRLVTVQLLLERGANPNLMDKHGWSPLKHAVIRKNQTILEALLSSPKIQIDCRDEDGKSPLFWAAIHRSDSMVKVLLRNGANIDSYLEAKTYDVAPGSKIYTDIQRQQGYQQSKFEISNDTALAGYQTQLMLLAQQNQKRLIMARQE